jgi:hypothetical protein
MLSVAARQGPVRRFAILARVAQDGGKLVLVRFDLGEKIVNIA